MHYAVVLSVEALGAITRACTRSAYCKTFLPDYEHAEHHLSGCLTILALMRSETQMLSVLVKFCYQSLSWCLLISSLIPLL